jgi:hypothetical protein
MSKPKMPRPGMKTAQYIRQEKAIHAATTNDIRQRWLYGLRLLRDVEAFAPGSSQLRPGWSDELVKSAKANNLKLSAREIRYRLQAARAYKTDSQIRQAAAEFDTWTALIAADFPPFESDPDEPPADHRTDDEKKRDAARRLAEIVGEQGSLFPLDQFEPTQAEIKDLRAYAEQMAELTERFAKRDKERLAYVDELAEAAGGDESMTWQEAHERLTGEASPP